MDEEDLGTSEMNILSTDGSGDHRRGEHGGEDKPGLGDGDSFGESMGRVEGPEEGKWEASQDKDAGKKDEVDDILTPHFDMEFVNV